MSLGEDAQHIERPSFKKYAVDRIIVVTIRAYGTCKAISIQRMELMNDFKLTGSRSYSDSLLRRHSLLLVEVLEEHVQKVATLNGRRVAYTLRQRSFKEV